MFAVERLQTGPESAVLLSWIWIALFLLVELREKYSAKKIALLTADLIVIGFLQITALGVIVGVMAILGILAKKEQIPMTSYLRALLVLMLGLAAGNIAERMVLYGFASGMDVTVSSSLEVLLDDLADGWSQGFLTGVLEGIAGKLYSLMAGTLLLICPGIWALLKKCREMKKGRIEKEDPFFGGVLLIFVFQLLIAVLTANASGISGSILSLDYMTVIAGPVLLVGAMQLKKSAVWDKELLGYLLALCLSSFVTASIFNGNAVDIAEPGKYRIFICIDFKRAQSYRRDLFAGMCSFAGWDCSVYLSAGRVQAANADSRDQDSGNAWPGSCFSWRGILDPETGGAGLV